jgi:hypothetical protein
VQPGTSSAAGDTILGPAGANTLVIDDTSGTGASGTISLNGGPPVAFTNADTNLEVAGPNGEVVHVNTTAITPGFNGTVNITANGTLSVDGGASTQPITFSGDQVVTNSKTGAVTNVDSTKIRTTGDTSLDYTGTADAFQVLIALRNDLENASGLSSTQLSQTLSQRMGEIQQAGKGSLDATGKQSATLQSLQSLQQRLTNVQLDTKQTTSDLQSADISAVAIGIQSQQNLLSLTYASAARIMNLSLLNFLQ